MGVHGSSFRYFCTISPWSSMRTNVLYGFFFGCSSCCSPVRENTGVWAMCWFDEECSIDVMPTCCGWTVRDDDESNEWGNRCDMQWSYNVTSGILPPQTPAYAFHLFAETTRDINVCMRLFGVRPNVYHDRSCIDLPLCKPRQTYPSTDPEFHMPYQTFPPGHTWCP